MTQPKRIAILGSTGSIGVQALDLISLFEGRFQIVALAARSNVELLGQQAEKFRPQVVAVADPAFEESLRKRCSGLGVEIRSGPRGLEEVACHPEVDLVLSAIVGAAGLPPTLSAIQAGKSIALANKEPLVMAGELMLREAEKNHSQLLPVDSEHSALHQCLRGERREEVRRLILTASGGPFRKSGIADLESADPTAALNHPTWDMGPKISIDSATLMNKGLEVIEAHWLFSIPPEKIEVVLHPQSLVHSMVEMQDGSVMCQLGTTDMRGPIQYALTYPDRWVSGLPGLDLTGAPALEFQLPDEQRFPCLPLAYRALKMGGTAPAALNAANEVAVEAFLERRAGFMDIPRTIEKVLDEHSPLAANSLEAILGADHHSRQVASRLLGTGALV